MKLMFLALIFPIFLFGCISHEQVETEDILNDEELQNFEDIYGEIKRRENEYNLNHIEDINQFENYLNEYEEYLNNKTDEDSLASLKFVEFRTNLLSVQKNILIAEEILSENLTCQEEENLYEGLEYINKTVENIEKTIISINEFNETFPEYIKKTEISNETIEDLTHIKKEINEIRDVFLIEIEKC